VTRALVLNARSGPSQEREEFVRWIRNRPLARPVFISEAHELNLAPAGNVAQSAGGSKGRRENAIVTRAKPRTVQEFQLTPDLGGRNNHDRWTVRAGFGDRALYGLHANAAIQESRADGGGWRSTEGARVWREGFAEKLAGKIKMDLMLGLDVMVGGDLNWHGTAPIPGSPAAVFGELGMRFVNRELMWLAWTPGWRLSSRLFADPVKVLDSPPGSDHIALSVRLRKV